MKPIKAVECEGSATNQVTQVKHDHFQVEFTFDGTSITLLMQIQ